MTRTADRQLASHLALRDNMRCQFHDSEVALPDRSFHLIVSNPNRSDASVLFTPNSTIRCHIFATSKNIFTDTTTIEYRTTQT